MYIYGVKYETFRMYQINPVQLYHCLSFQNLIHWLIPSTNYMTCTVLHYVQQTTWLAQSYTMFNKLHESYTMFNKLHESYTMFNKLHESYTMFNKLHDLHSLTLCSTNYMSLTLCSTNYMTCTVLHYIQQTTWLAQSQNNT